MRIKKRQTFMRLLGIIAVGVVGIVGYQLILKPPPEPPDASAVSDVELVMLLLIEPQNLPTPWRPDLIHTNSLSVPEGLGASRWFAESGNRTWVNVFQDVFVFPHSVQAERYYDEQVEEYGTLEFQGWDSMPTLRFAHHADATHLACHESYVNNHHHFGCYVVGRYGRIVTVVGGHIFDRKWLTAEQFRQVLIEVDSKLVEQLESVE